MATAELNNADCSSQKYTRSCEDLERGRACEPSEISGMVSVDENNPGQTRMRGSDPVHESPFETVGRAEEGALSGMEMDATMGKQLEQAFKVSQGEEGFANEGSAAAAPRPRTPEPRWKKRSGGQGSRVTLNVGGQTFETSIETLAYDSQSMLAAKVMRHMPEEDQIIWFDRDPERFRHVLNYLRCQTVWLDEVRDLRALQEEADYFGLQGLHQICEENIQEALRSKDEVNKLILQRLEDLHGNMKTLTENLEGQKTNHRKEPISGVRRRRLDYVNFHEPVFRMDEDF